MSWWIMPVEWWSCIGKSLHLQPAQQACLFSTFIDSVTYFQAGYSSPQDPLQDARTDKSTARLPGNYKVTVIINYSASYFISSFDNLLIIDPLQKPKKYQSTFFSPSNEPSIDKEKNIFCNFWMLGIQIWRKKCINYNYLKLRKNSIDQIFNPHAFFSSFW